MILQVYNLKWLKAKGYLVKEVSMHGYHRNIKTSCKAITLCAYLKKKVTNQFMALLQI